METPEKEKLPTRRSGLIVLPFLILAGLLIAPPTRALLQTQLGLLHDITPFLTRLREMGVKEGPPSPAPTWEKSAMETCVARMPNDYGVQVGGALLKATYDNGGNPASQKEVFESFQRRYGAPLTALSARFPDRPALYAHLLRFMTQSTVRVSREAEVDTFQTGKPSTLTDRQVGYADSWAAFDQAAEQGEKLDPDNAYFPMIRAIWLFDAKRDAEGIAAVLRAGQKSRFEDYTAEETDSEWALYQHAYGSNSALIRHTIYAADLWPHFAVLRSLSRLTAYQAEKLEQGGHIQQGLALRHAMMQCGVRMRELGHTISAEVGGAIVAIQTNRPGGGPLVVPPANLSNEQRTDRRRDLYLAYLHKIGAEHEALWFMQVDTANRQMRSLIQAMDFDSLQLAPIRTLSGFWMLDMLLLINMAILLLLCTVAVVCGRIPSGDKALPIVVVVVIVGCLAVVLTMQWAEALTQIRLALNNLASMLDDTGAQANSMEFSNLVKEHPSVVHVGEVLVSLLLPVLTLLAIGAVSLVRRETFIVALPRGLRQGALVVATLLTVAYAGALIATAQVEVRTNAMLDGMTHNAIAYMQQHPARNRKP
ncbi:MAG: hypothetical protein JWN14_1722 [Chthonomonadales bacterium]|nr:hypothetical protein [Chthonomonadales bacterium]